MRCLLLILSLLPQMALCQLDLPELSPEGRLIQTVGYTNFEIRYGRPAVRERKIMGGLVPYNRIWRTGGGKCSTILFDQNVIVNNQTIPSGIYAIVTIPGQKEWTVMLNSDTSRIYGEPREYDISNEVVRVTVPSEKSNRFYESLTFALDIVKHDAILILSWENTQVQVPIATLSHLKALEHIKLFLEKNPNDPELLSAAAYYYFMNNENLEQALAWTNKTLTLVEERWHHRQKVDILERMKKYTDARNAAEAAIAFLNKTKPVDWENSIREYEAKMKGWPN